MLLKSYQKIIEFFHDNHGYLNFAALRQAGVTFKQIEELEYIGEVEKFARGWYWCGCCGFEKPKDYKYIELGKVNPNAIICLDSACFLGNLIETEPEAVSVATTRQDRMNLVMQFSIRRFYLQKTNLPGEICCVKTPFGEYRYYSPERTICDCLRLGDKIAPDVLIEVQDLLLSKQSQYQDVLHYAYALRAVKNVQQVLELGLKERME